MLMPAQPQQSTEPLKLTPHQRDIARLVARGLSTKEITAIMSDRKGRKISERTISSNLINITKVNRLQNRTELAWRLINDEYILIPKSEDTLASLPACKHTLLVTSLGLVLAKKTKRGKWIADGGIEIEPEYIISWHEFVTYEK
jgi:DNA-binding CsgD family transcriptional regulator